MLFSITSYDRGMSPPDPLLACAFSWTSAHGKQQQLAKISPNNEPSMPCFSLISPRSSIAQKMLTKGIM